MLVTFLSVHKIQQRSNAALQRPGDNCASAKLSMRDMLIPVRCKRLFDAAIGLTRTLLYDLAQRLIDGC